MQQPPTAAPSPTKEPPTAALAPTKEPVTHLFGADDVRSNRPDDTARIQALLDGSVMLVSGEERRRALAFMRSCYGKLAFPFVTAAVRLNFGSLPEMRRFMQQVPYVAMPRGDGLLVALLCGTDLEGEPAAYLVTSSLAVLRLADMEAPAACFLKGTCLHGELLLPAGESAAAQLALQVMDVQRVCGTSCRGLVLTERYKYAEELSSALRCTAFNLSHAKPVPASRASSLWARRQGKSVDGIVFLPNTVVQDTGFIFPLYQWLARHTVVLTAVVEKLANNQLVLALKYRCGRGVLIDIFQSFDYACQAVYVELKQNRALRAFLAEIRDRTRQEQVTVRTVECTIEVKPMATELLQEAQNKDLKYREQSKARERQKEKAQQQKRQQQAPPTPPVNVHRPCLIKSVAKPMPPRVKPRSFVWHARLRFIRQTEVPCAPHSLTQLVQTLQATRLPIEAVQAACDDRDLPPHMVPSLLGAPPVEPPSSTPPALTDDNRSLLHSEMDDETAAATPQREEGSAKDLQHNPRKKKRRRVTKPYRGP